MTVKEELDSMLEESLRKIIDIIKEQQYIDMETNGKSYRRT
ncbi:hypothetical protein [Brachyspira hampsonii]|nr:hypothetical protein [Brachyspira hampsonii]